MKKFKLTLILLLQCLLTNLAMGNAYVEKIKQNFIFTNWTFDNGFPTNNALDTLQNSEEYIWIATYDGLIRFDGKEFTLYNKYSEDSFNASSATALYEDSKKQLWIGTNENGIALYKNGKFKFFSSEQGFNATAVRRIKEDSNGNIWVASSNNLTKFSYSNNKWLIEDKISDYHFSDITFINNGQLVAIDNTGKIHIYNGNKFEDFLPDKKFLSKYKYQTLMQSNDGHIWLGTVSGEILRIANNGEIKVYKNENVFSINNILQIKNSQYNDMIIFCSDGGLGVLDEAGNKFNIFKEIDGLINNSIETMFVDKEFNIWIASKRAGLQKITVGKFKNITVNHGLPYPIVNSIEINSNNEYLVGTNSGLGTIKNGKIIKTELTDFFKNIRVRHILNDSNNNLWISTYSDKGLVKISNNQIQSINEKQGLSSKKVRLVFEDSKGYIWIGTTAGLNLIKDPSKDDMELINHIEGLPPQYVMCVTESPNGDIIVGSDGNGIYVIDKDFNITNLKKEDGLAGNIIFKIYRDSADNIWIATNQGLSLWKDHTFYNFNMKDGFMADALYQIIEDDFSNMWFTTSKGIFSVETRELLEKHNKEDRKLNVKGFGLEDGFLDSSTATSWGIKANDGKIWFPTLKGISILDRRNMQINNKDPKIVIQSIDVDDEKFSPAEAKIIQPDSKRIKFKYAALSYRNPHKVMYKYFLDGFDSKWSQATTEREANYTNLPYGDYTFYIKASNNDGIWNKEALAYSFTRKAAIYETTWFRIAIILGLILIVSLIFTLRIIRLNEKRALISKMLDDTITALTSAIDAKDSYTKGHSQRVAEISEKIAIELGFTGDRLTDLKYSALLHDIGKIGIDDSILKKKGSLTDDEYSKIKEHPLIGSHILDKESLKKFIPGTEHHHERYDGKGYGSQLKGKEIPIEARIIAVADAYDAMMSERTYRKKLGRKKTLAELKKCSGTQFDPKIVAVFNRISHEIDDVE